MKLGCEIFRRLDLFSQGQQAIELCLLEAERELQCRPKYPLARLDCVRKNFHLRERPLAEELFGEGLTAVGNELFQLTWRAGLGLIYDSGTLAQSGQFTYAGEGWGLAWDGTQFIMSDGSASLRFLDRETLREAHRVQVQDGDQPITALNELEFVEGYVFANVWNTTRIAVIRPQSGQVRGWLDLKDILPAPFRTETVGVLNGIAYDADEGRLFVTGKRWPRLFEIELMPPIDQLAD